MAARPRRIPVGDAGESALAQIAAEICAFDLIDDFSDAESAPLPGADLPFDDWARRFLPGLFRSEPAAHHRQAHRWFEELQSESTSPALILAWNRGGAKSATIEGCCARLAFTLKRRFVLYVSETQDQADKHVASIRTLLVRAGATPRLTEFGQSAGWRANLLRTANGFNVLALGLDSAGRGVRFDEFRPDLMVFDDLDERHDTPKTTSRKIATLTETILPAGAAHCDVVFGQNVILESGIMDQVVRGTADFLTERIVSFVSAVEGLRITWEDGPDGERKPAIAQGVATWPAGLPLSALQAILRKIGPRSFLREYQHQVAEQGGGLWDGLPFRYLSDSKPPFPAPLLDTGLPRFERLVVAVDPSGSRRGDEAGIVAAGSVRLASGQLIAVILEDLSDQMSPKTWAQESIGLYRRLGAHRLLCERNFGGELVEDNLKDFPGAPPVTMVTVSRGKLIRAEPVHQRYESGLVWHARRFSDLESQMTRWHPGSGQDSPGALDAAVIALSYLFGIADYVKPEKPVTAILPSARIAGGVAR